ncbi:MAG: phosphoribosylamine--glycine ligase [bacterium]|nr:phosphoribosylamine--glycine ligase [bacterium]
MKALVVGSGGREHALAWGISRSPNLSKLFIAPGNGGTDRLGENVSIPADDVTALLEFAGKESVDLTVIGPEAPLVEGVVDRFREAGRACFGPAQAAARLEGSKVFAKMFMKRHGIPTADFEVFDNADAACAYVREKGAPLVIKADGLAAGKGVFVAESVQDAESAIDEIMVRKAFGESGRTLLIEERLVGREVSVHAICSVERAVMFPPAQDHKRVYDGDKGPNTGGMGAYAPVPFVTATQHEEIFESIIMKTLKGMRRDGTPYTGVLYAGLMMTDSGPKVLEFNVRFGDPETQVLLPMLDGDLLDLLTEAAEGRIPKDVRFYGDRCAATVVMASDGYPGLYEKGAVISGLADTLDDNRVVFHAGTVLDGDKVITSGGRVLAVTAWGPSLSEAIGHAYEGVDRIRFDGAFYRKDIGRKVL